MSPSDSPVFSDKKKDTYSGKPDSHMVWASHKTINYDGSGKYLQYRHNRPLPNKTCQTAMDYIAGLVKIYPVQLRYAMARPLWERFCEAWCDSGDLKSALMSI